MEPKRKLTPSEWKSTVEARKDSDLEYLVALRRIMRYRLAFPDDRKIIVKGVLTGTLKARLREVGCHAYHNGNDVYTVEVI